MNPIKFSLRYPAVTLILTAMVVIVGIHAFLKMQRTEDPTITIRTGLVAAMYPGATSEQVEKQVTKTLEKHIFKFPEVRKEKTYSTSRPGVVIINVELEDNVKNSDVFWAKLRHEMNVVAEHRTPRRRHGAGGQFRFRRYRRDAGSRPRQTVRISGTAGLCGQDPRRDAHRPRGGKTRHQRKPGRGNLDHQQPGKDLAVFRRPAPDSECPESSETSSRAEGISRPTGRRSP